VRRFHPQSPWASLRWPLFASIGVLGYGVAGYTFVLGWSFIDGLYMTLLTMTTVGFTEVRPLDTLGKVFTISLLIMGVTLLVLTLSIAASVLQQDPIRERMRRRRMRRRIGTLRDHVIVCGYGRVGRTVAETLAQEDRPFLIVDRSDTKERELMEDEVNYLIGDATSREDLADAGLAHARALISAVDDDAENIYITMVARALNPDLWIVARASEEGSRERLLTVGANRVYSPFVTAGREMATAAVNPNIVDFMEVTTTGAPALRLEELEIEPGSELTGKSLGEVRGRARPLAVRRSDGELVIPPRDDLVLGEGDLLVMIGEREALRPLERGR
jgi:voltage-gated potassium channel